MKKFVCVGCYNEYDNKAEAEACCGEEAEEIQEEPEDEKTDENQTEDSEDETELL
ncbi:hypothetical protein KKG83_00195 [Candidatus Micrarchaeota archaeon]|nr:hypothetical protein [Candidatus Micrarchaeota archaeon]